MASITGTRILSGNDLYTPFTTLPSGYTIGDTAYGNGKTFRLALVGASALVMGNVLQSSVIDTSYTNMAVGTAALAGDNTIQITNGTATITSQMFEGGSLSIYTAGTIAVGDEYTIMGVSGTLTTGGALVVNLDRPLRSAVTTSAKVNMRRSPSSGVIQSPATTLTGTPAGVALFAAAAATYCWIQTGGVGAALSDGSTILVGSSISVPSGTAGAVILSSAGLPIIGYSMQVAAAAKGIGVMLLIN